MEILESQDPEKKKLIELSERHKRNLEKGMSDLSSSTKKMLTNALIIGGVMAISYVIVRQLSSSSDKPKKHKKRAKVTVVQPTVSNDADDDDDYEESSPGLLASIGSRVANQATVILVELARQKLMEYLESRIKDK